MYRGGHLNQKERRGASDERAKKGTNLLERKKELGEGLKNGLLKNEEVRCGLY